MNLNKIQKTFSEFNGKFGNMPVLVSVRRGLTYIMPLILIGSMALLFISLPVPSYQSFMTHVFGSQWKNIFLYIRDGTFNILSLLMVISISYSYAVEYGERFGDNVSPIIAALVSLSSFIAISGFSKEGFNISNFGVIGAFIAIVVSITSSKLFINLNSISVLRIKAFTDGANSVFNYALTSIYPAAITIALFAILNQVLTACFGISDIQAFISDFLCGTFAQIKNPFWSGILFVALIHIFWFLGMHGSNILEPVAQSIFVPALAANQQLIRSGQVPGEIFTKTFFDTFVLMGGCGTILCLVCAILIAGRHKNQLRLAKMSIVPVLFNINELIVFGIPIVLNPIFIIPFLFVPIILTMSSFLAMRSGLVPFTCSLVEWTTPIFLSGYTSTNSINGSLLQLFNLVLGTLCYIPFVRIAQGVSDIQVKNNIKKVYAMFEQGEKHGIASTFLTRHDDIGGITRFLVADLEHDLQDRKITLFYQPQVDFEGNIFGMEALLRWNHGSYGFIYPPLIIALAEESQLMDKLGLHILDTACSDLRKMHELGFENLTVSVNVSSAQLENDYFTEKLKEIMNRYRIKPHTLKIEITEHLALASSQRIMDQIIAIKKLGVKLAMDDFGMGHSSLIYLKEYEFDTIKLDGSLVREILYNNNCCNIISSIVLLGKSLNYSVIAEYVENEEQKRVLHELGCNLYQGYLYSRALPIDELMEYIQDKNMQIKV